MPLSGVMMLKLAQGETFIVGNQSVFGESNHKTELKSRHDSPVVEVPDSDNPFISGNVQAAGVVCGGSGFVLVVLKVLWEMFRQAILEGLRVKVNNLFKFKRSTKT